MNSNPNENVNENENTGVTENESTAAINENTGVDESSVQDEGDIDDILDILQKRKEQDMKNRDALDDAPTRVDTDAVKAPVKNEYHTPIQSNIFDDDFLKDSDDFDEKTAVLPQDNIASPEKAPQSESIKAQDTPEKEAPASPVSKPVEAEAKVSEKAEQNITDGNASRSSSQSTAASTEQSKPKQTAVSRPKPVTSVPSYSGATINLNDFDDMEKLARQKKVKKSKEHKKKFLVPGYVKVILYLLVVFSVSIFLSVCAINIGNDVYAFVKDEKEATVTIKEGATLEEVAEELYKNGIIEYPTVYTYYSKFRTDGKSYYTGNFIAGEHVLKSTMNYDRLISELFESTYTNAIVKVTIPEGFTVYNILNLLEEKKVIDSEGRKKLIEKLGDPSLFDYDFLPEKEESETEKIYMLEGYLFPDTYEFYVGENLDSIIDKFLSNFNVKFDAKFYDRCEELGMTVDEVVTLASMIQAEGNNSHDFYLISSVFHNRLNHASKYPRLESDATSVYAMHETRDRKEMTPEDIKNCDSPYNSYTNNGLPPGAICNPGHDAINAALYPAEYITETDERGNSKEISVEYYYFYTASSNGKTYFSSNLNTHNAFIAADQQKNVEQLERLAQN